MKKVGFSEDQAREFFDLVAENPNKSFWHWLSTGIEFHMIQAMRKHMGSSGARLHDELFFVCADDFPDLKFRFIFNGKKIGTFGGWFKNEGDFLESDEQYLIRIDTLKMRISMKKEEVKNADVLNNDYSFLMAG